MFKWFEALFGFEEYALKVRADLPNYLKTQACFDLKHSSGNVVLKSKVNGRAFDVGRFSTPSLRELRSQCDSRFSGAADRDMVVVEHRVINCASRVHFENPGSTVQAASQFNCLEVRSFLLTRFNTRLSSILYWLYSFFLLSYCSLCYHSLFFVLAFKMGFARERFDDGVVPRVFE